MTTASSSQRAITPAALAVLRRLEAARDDDHEGTIVAEGTLVYIGDDRISRRTLNRLLQLLALRDVSDGGGLERFVINSIGRLIIKRPAIAETIHKLVAEGVPFSVSDDAIVAHR